MTAHSKRWAHENNVPAAVSACAGGVTAVQSVGGQRGEGLPGRRGAARGAGGPVLPALPAGSRSCVPVSQLTPLAEQPSLAIGQRESRSCEHKSRSAELSGHGVRLALVGFSSCDGFSCFR